MTPRQQVLDGLAADPPQSGLFTDFDGTLSPIVADPERAAPLPAALSALRRLAPKLQKVAVVSGRPVRFLARHFEGAAIDLYGLHGLERWGGGGAEPASEAAPYAAAVRSAVAFAKEAGLDGLAFEDKGLALTLHWRRAADGEKAAAAGAELAAQLAERFGLVARPGKASIELLPPVGIDKGSVVTREGAGLAAACFLGDDAGDLAAFRALDALEAGGARVFRIGVDSTEAPPELLAAADLVLDGPKAAAGLLEELAGRLGG